MTNIKKFDLLKRLPSLEALMECTSLRLYIDLYSEQRMKVTLEKVLEELKTDIEEGIITSIDQDDILKKAISSLSKEFIPSLKPVINATGIVLHPYLGRSPLSKDAVNKLVHNSTAYCNLDFNLMKGIRFNRQEHLRLLLSQITGAESAIVVNNNASAIMLIANTFANQQEVLISRSEIIDMEDEFRLPEVIDLADANLVEVGTTNKTILNDYSKNITERTHIILKVHTSNYYIKGDTRKVESFALADLARKHDLISVVDLGTGLLTDLKQFGLPHEPTVKEYLNLDVDLITFSGDKLLGGPQAGIILGKQKFIDRIIQNPLNRVLRPDKMTLSALEATLLLYLNPENATEKIPALQMLTKKVCQIEASANRIYEDIRHNHSIECGVKKSFSEVGGSIIPEAKLPTFIVWVKPAHMCAIDLHSRLLDHSILTTLKNDTIIIDPRCLLKRDYKVINLVMEQVLRLSI